MNTKKRIVAILLIALCFGTSNAILDESLPVYTAVSGVAGGGVATALMRAADVDTQSSVVVGLVAAIACSMLSYWNLKSKTVTARCQHADYLLQQLNTDHILANVPSNDDTHYSGHVTNALEQKVDNAEYLLKAALEDQPRYEETQHINRGLGQVRELKTKTNHMQAHVTFEQVAESLEVINQDPLVLPTMNTEYYMGHVLQTNVRKKYPIVDAFSALERHDNTLKYNQLLLQDAAPKVIVGSRLADMMQAQQQKSWCLRGVISQRMVSIKSSPFYGQEQVRYEENEHRQELLRLEQQRLKVEQKKAEAEASKARAEHDRNVIEASKAQSERDRIAIECEKLRLQKEELRLKQKALGAFTTVGTL